MNYEDIYFDEKDISDIRNWYDMTPKELINYPEYLLFELGIENDINMFIHNNSNYSITVDCCISDGINKYYSIYDTDMTVYNQYAYKIIQYINTTTSSDLQDMLDDNFMPTFLNDFKKIFRLFH